MRNAKYQAEPNTERGIMARAINDMFMKAKEIGVIDDLCN